MKLSLNSFFHGIFFALRQCKFRDIFLKVKQYKIIDAILSGKDVIGVLPTGYGKSIIFQLLPFIHEYLLGKETIVIVIAPLNAIIDDQIKSLLKRGVRAGCMRKKESKVENRDIREKNDWDSECESSDDELHQDLQDDQLSLLEAGHFRLLFMHPECFVSCRKGRNILASEIYKERVTCCVIDEAHLVQEWGEEFRTDFRKLSQLRAIFPSAPMVALTASAPPKQLSVLTDALFLQNPLKVVGNLDRPNIYIGIHRRKASSLGSESYESILRPIAEELKENVIHFPLTIIYLPLRWCGYAFKLFDQILQEKSYLPENTIDPRHRIFAQFHAAQTEIMKQEILEELTSAESLIRVVFATVALGLGVNIPNVKQIIHIGPPRTLESYYQEIGRAGRNGKPAKALMYYNGSDISANKPGMTYEMREFCTTVTTCLRDYLLKYLGSSKSQNNILTSCCSNCESMQSVPQKKLTPSFSEPRPNPVRKVSEEQRQLMLKLLKKYRLELGTKISRFGSIDLSTGFTISLVEQIVAQSEYITSAEQLLSGFAIWDKKHAVVCMDVITRVCGHS